MLKKNIYHSCVQFIMVKNMLFVYLQFFTLSCGKIKSYQTSVGASVYLLVNYWSLGPVTVKNVAITAEGGDDYQKHNACRRAWAVYSLHSGGLRDDAFHYYTPRHERSQERGFPGAHRRRHTILACLQTPIQPAASVHDGGLCS